MTQPPSPFPLFHTSPSALSLFSRGLGVLPPGKFTNFMRLCSVKQKGKFRPPLTSLFYAPPPFPRGVPRSSLYCRGSTLLVCASGRCEQLFPKHQDTSITSTLPWSEFRLPGESPPAAAGSPCRGPGGQ